MSKLARVIGAMQYLLLRLLRILSRLFKACWVFFPSILFIVLAIWCFWTLGQGKDLVVAFTENHQAKAFFLIAIAFWVYVSWYSSRVIAYIKKSKQEEYVAKVAGQSPGNEPSKRSFTPNYFELPADWLEKFPRLIGYGCLLSIEIAVLLSPALGPHAISPGKAFLYLLLGLIISWGLDNIVQEFADKSRVFARYLFYMSLAIFLVAAVIVVMMQKGSILVLFWVLLLLHAVYMLYINLRHSEQTNPPAKPPRPFFLIRILYAVMAPLRIPRRELGYFLWFNIVSITGLLIYLLAIRNMNISWQIGPFPFVLLAFAVLGGFGNIVTALSVKASVNFHFLLVVLALLLGSNETHYVRTIPYADRAQQGIYNQRQDLYQYFDNWVSSRGAEIDSASGTYRVYLVLANGGASRSGYWTASVLGRLEDTTYGKPTQFSRHLFCLSGTSGGGVGVATFFSLLHERKKLPADLPVSYTHSARSFLKKDFLSSTLAHMLGPDYFKYVFHINRQLPDRAGALELTMEEGARTCADTLKVAMDQPFSQLLALNGQPYDAPILCINTTRMQDGNPGIVTNIRLNREMFNNRVDVMDILNDTLDMRLSTASVLGARFPYISPAGRIDETISAQNRVHPNDSSLVHYFVDGGYFDNSGAGVVQEMLRAVLNHTAESKDTLLKSRVRKLQFMVLHITNSPVGVAPLNPVGPINNDLSSPILTILGAYDMQTTVNDRRLDNFLKDITRNQVCAGGSYYPIHLYRDTEERKEARRRGDTLREVPYAMNWFISDTTRTRMDNRLLVQPKLNQLIRQLDSLVRP
ncbi:MAG: hypothetical protein P0Y53_06425 [Candidatus Pseudobacter hemicellulosilyticus]|uniref:Patatin-like phospholipase n=1 Tax=Candidatus Pseudobacter hemicellulosilyticus TaxID=3121375 RepID=A0AAJ6BJ93_9BACT|nr:MAG: hypothetical protein P0Y53_06425 [Pseudobacter sp.]